MRHAWLLAVSMLGCSHAAGDRSAPESLGSAASPASTGSSTASPAGPARVGHVSASCAPWDGGAIDFVIDDVAACPKDLHASVNLAVWKGLPLAAGKSFHFADPSQDGHGGRCRADGKCESARRVDLEIDSYDDQTVTGSYALEFRDGTTEKARFSATWCTRKAICG